MQKFMKIKIGINGMGRIGRMIVRSIFENIYVVKNFIDLYLEKLLSEIDVFNEMIFASEDELSKLGQNSLSNKTIFFTS